MAIRKGRLEYSLVRVRGGRGSLMGLGDVKNHLISEGRACLLAYIATFPSLAISISPVFAESFQGSLTRSVTMCNRLDRHRRPFGQTM